MKYFNKTVRFVNKKTLVPKNCITFGKSFTNPCKGKLLFNQISPLLNISSKTEFFLIFA